jgi:drug/metabolite transporter (DMT)-like permease
MLITFRGEFAALAAAVIWAIASYIYIFLGKQISASTLNFAKSGIAILLTLVTLLSLGELFPTVSWETMALLSLSGVLGIGMGDTAFFASLSRLGSRRALLLESLSPPLTALSALVWLQEQLSPLAYLGIALTITGVAWVVVERTTDMIQPYPHSWAGTGFGLLAALGQACGAVTSRAALANTAVNPLWSTFIRLTAGVFALGLWMLVRQRSQLDFRALRSPRFLLTLVGASFASTFLAIWLQQTALKYAAAGIAQALSATSPLFVIPIALFLGESVSLRAVLGVFIALSGIWLLFQQ